MLLSVVNLKKDYPVEKDLLGRPERTVHAVEDVSFQLKEGEILGLVGESGCGKSTVGKCVVGLVPPSSGKVLWKDREIREEVSSGDGLRSKFQLVFQNPFTSLDPRQTVLSVLGEALGTLGPGAPEDRKKAAEELLVQVGLTASDLGKFPHEFSGGQRQRIALAKALALEPELIVLDEPVSSLDVSVQASILNLLVELNKERKVAYLFISHDLQVVAHLSRRVLVMYLGKVVEEGPVEKVLQKPRHPYTRILLEASRGVGSPVLGEPGSQIERPKGCAFHPRCPFAEVRCRQEPQTLSPSGEEWRVACWKSGQIQGS